MKYDSFREVKSINRILGILEIPKPLEKEILDEVYSEIMIYKHGRVGLK